MKRIAIFCGASIGFDEVYRKEAHRLGKYLAQRNIGIVFGGGKTGMMGTIADAMLAEKAEVIGVIPGFLRHVEVEHPQVEQMITSKNMSDRKVIISKMVDAYIALPGGFGTLDEVMEALTLGQLNIEEKPIGLLNTKGFFDALIQQFDFMVQEGFLKKENRDMLLVSDQVEELIRKMENYQAPKISKPVHSIASK